MSLKEGLRVLHAYTAGHFDFYLLAGDAKKTIRKHVMEAILEQKMPIAKCGITAMRQVFHEALGVRRDCGAREDDDFIVKAREVLGLARKGTPAFREMIGLARKATHAFVGRGAKCEYDWPDGDEPSDACGRSREEH